MDSYTPFCGDPPSASDVLGRWTFDPVLVAGLLIALGVIWGATQGAARRKAVIGWGIAALLFVSPLCAASMALFSARVLQHLLLTLVAAPLLAAGLRPRGIRPEGAASGFAALFWFWHLPGPYGLTFQSDLLYWTMHLSLLGAAMVFWSTVRINMPRQPISTSIALVATAAQMTLLAVMLVVSNTLWHGWHALTTATYGITAMGDQALAGALMWVAGGTIFTSLVAGLIFTYLSEKERAVTA